MGAAAVFIACSALLPPQIHPHKRAIIHKHNNKRNTNRPLVVSGQDNVESSVIVGGVVYDLFCVRNADVNCIHYPSCEVTPVKYL